jgi:hypothetical protein
MWREDLTDACRGIRFHLGFVRRAVRGIETMPSDFTSPCLAELNAAEEDLREALIRVEQARADLAAKPTAPIMQAAE